MSDSSHYSDGLSNEENINSDEEPYRFSNIVDDVPSSPNIPNKNQSAGVDNQGIDNQVVNIDNQVVDNGINKNILSIDNSNNAMKKSMDTNSPTNSQSSVEDIINTSETEDSVNDKTKKKPQVHITDGISIHQTKEAYKNFSVNDKHYVNVPTEIAKMKQKRFEYKKSIFVKHLQKKIDGIDKRMRYINHKYTDYQTAYKFMNGFVIILSSVLTLFEALKNIIDMEHFNEVSKTIFGIAPLVISTLVSLMATLIKFQKYQEHMEALSVTEEKGIIAMSKLKRVRELIYFSKDDKSLEEIKQTYLDETYQFYNEVNVKIEIELDEEDYIKYYKRMSNIDVNLGNVFVKKYKSVRDIIFKHDTIHRTIKENKKKYKTEDSDDEEKILPEALEESKKLKSNNSSCMSRP